jgi:hypothetical protein
MYQLLLESTSGFDVFDGMILAYGLHMQSLIARVRQMRNALTLLSSLTNEKASSFYRNLKQGQGIIKSRSSRKTRINAVQAPHRSPLQAFAARIRHCPNSLIGSMIIPNQPINKFRKRKMPEGHFILVFLEEIVLHSWLLGHAQYKSASSVFFKDGRSQQVRCDLTPPGQTWIRPCIVAII